MPELSLEHIAPILDFNEITNHWLKVIVCQYTRQNEILTSPSESQSHSELLKSPESDAFATLNSTERIVLEAAKDLKKTGEELSQEKLFSKVCEKISDYTEFTTAVDELSVKGYLISK